MIGIEPLSFWSSLLRSVIVAWYTDILAFTAPAFIMSPWAITNPVWTSLSGFHFNIQLQTCLPLLLKRREIRYLGNHQGQLILPLKYLWIANLGHSRRGGAKLNGWLSPDALKVLESDLKLEHLNERVKKRKIWVF